MDEKAVPGQGPRLKATSLGAPQITRSYDSITEIYNTLSLTAFIRTQSYQTCYFRIWGSRIENKTNICYLKQVKFVICYNSNKKINMSNKETGTSSMIFKKVKELSQVGINLWIE